MTLLSARQAFYQDRGRDPESSVLATYLAFEKVRERDEREYGKEGETITEAR